jgi:hypothetical protein
MIRLIVADVIKTKEGRTHRGGESQKTQPLSKKQIAKEPGQ